MDLRLRCTTTTATFDVSLEVDSGHTIAEVRDALVDHARGLGLDVDHSAELTSPNRPFDVADTVFSSGIVTGQHVGLGVRPSREQDRFAVRVVAVSGPDSGAVVLLAPGRHTIGREPTAAVAMTDASVTAAHAHLDVRSDAAIRVVPTDGDVRVDDAPVDGPTRIEPGSTVRVGASFLELSVVRRTHRTDALGSVAHNRSPYRRPIVHARKLAALANPPEVATKPPFVLASALLPVASGGMLVMISGRIQFLFLVLLSPLLVGWSYLQDRRSGRRRHEQDRASYLESVDERVEAGLRALTDELIERRRAAPTADVLAQHADLLQPRLWERDRATAHFGELRVGVATVTSEVGIDIGDGGDPDLVKQATDAVAFIDQVDRAPVLIGFDAEPVLAFVGDAQARQAAARAVLVQAAALHSPEDLVVAAAVSGTTLSAHEWLKWLPHVRSSASPLPGPLLAMWPDERGRLLVDLANLVEHRLANEDDATNWPRVLVLIDEASDPDRSVLSRVLDGAGRAGIWVVWVGEASDGVPRQADAVLKCGGRSTPSVLERRDVEKAATGIEPDRFGVDESLAFGRSIAPVRDATSTTQIAALPRLVPLYDVIPGGRPDVESVLELWARCAPGLEAAVGIGSDGEHVLDLVEQGPHALIAGTSGAGKSEFLQAWVAGLAAAHPPDQLNMLFIDYKGGAFSAAFASLPHNVGTVTNLDEALSLRALTSLRAELDRRMELLGGDAKDIVELAAVDPGRAPPRLVIIVDEFATLVNEIPGFVAGMVDLAQRGRSLGIHLVLATQRPSGSVNDNILANTNLRVSLRVLDSADSTSVIGAPDAAQLPAPLRGRAFARTGPGQLHPFQAAFGGAADDVESERGDIAVASFDFSGGQAFGPKPSVGGGSSRSQLEVVVGVTADAHARTGRPAPRRPWLEPLAEVVTLAEIDRPAELAAQQAADPGRIVVVGLADRPERQGQDAWTVDLESSGGLLIFGGGGSGRTTTLRSIAAALVAQGGTDAVQLHVVDAASRALGSLSVLPHVASILTVDDLEPVARLVQVLEDEVAARRATLAETHAESLASLRSTRCEPVVPRIVVLVDGLGALREALDTPDAYEWFNRFIRLTAEGRQVGIHFVVTSDRRAGLAASVVGSMGSRLVLPMAEADEAISLGVPRPIAAASERPAGRGFADETVVQVAVLDADTSGAGQALALERLASTLPPTPTEPLPELPEVVAGPMESASGLRVAMGLRDLSLLRAEVDLAAGHLLITGPAGSGRSTTASGLARALGCAEGRPRLVGVGGPTSPLATEPTFDETAFSRGTHAAALEAVAATVDPEGRSIEAVVFVDAIEDVESMETDRALERLTGLPSVRLVAVADTATVARTFSGWLADLKRHRRALFLQPESKAEIDAVLGLRVSLRPGQRFPIGRALLAEGRTAGLVQVYAE